MFAILPNKVDNQKPLTQNPQTLFAIKERHPTDSRAINILTK